MEAYQALSSIQSGDVATVTDLLIKKVGHVCLFLFSFPNLL